MLSTTHTPAPCLLLTPAPSDADTIMHSRQWIHENKSRGVDCPTCGRHVQEYRRTISSSLAVALEAMYKQHGSASVHLDDVRSRYNVDASGNLAMLAHWGLLQEHAKIRGSWEVTSKGADWITRKEHTVPQSVYLYHGELTGQCTHPVTFQQAKSGTTCRHGHIPHGEVDPLREDAKSSDAMFNAKTLVDRRSKTARFLDSDDDLFESITQDVPKVDNPLHHDSFHGDESIQKAKGWVERKLKGKGGFCPSCDRIAAYNRTNMSDDHARLLIEIYKQHRTNPVHVPSFKVRGATIGKLGHASESAHRGLLHIDTSKDGGARSGWYSLTEAGVIWIMNLSKTPESIWSYNRFSREINRGKTVSVTEVLGSGKYRYADLMYGIAVANHSASDD